MISPSWSLLTLSPLPLLLSSTVSIFRVFYSLGFICFFFFFSPFCVETTLGTFGQVLECWDIEKREAVAIKIVRSIRKYREAAMIEIDVLQSLLKHDLGGTR